jgi:teichoic acid transport system permease protein
MRSALIVSVPSQSVAPDASAQRVGSRTERPSPPSPPSLVTATMTSADALRIAQDNGLKPMGVRPPLREYIPSLWRFRSFVRVLSTSKAYAKNRNNYLGQFWTILTPILNAAVYIIIFGFLIGTKRGLDNVIAFIVVGVFTFRFFEHAVSGGTKSIRGNLSLVRSVRFPRAALPISTVLTELAIFVPEVVVMAVIVFASGYIPGLDPVPITWRWLLLPVAVALLWIFNTGCAFFMARWGAITPDVQNIIGFAMRFIMYGSGVLFSIDHYVSNPTLNHALQHQPVAVYLYVIRSCLLNEPTIHMALVWWLWAAGWAIVTFAVGFFYFWHGEERYGRD